MSLPQLYSTKSKFGTVPNVLSELWAQCQMFLVNFGYGKLYVYNTNEVHIYNNFQYISENSILTFNLDPRSKVMAPNESPYMISYMCTIQMESLALLICEIFEKKSLFDLSRSPGVKFHGWISTKN